MKEILNTIGGVIGACCLAAGWLACTCFLGFFWPAYSFGKEVWENWKKGERGDLIRNLLTFLITWGIFYFGILYIFYDGYFR